MFVIISSLLQIDERSSICNKDEIITMNKYWFHKHVTNDNTAYTLKYSIALVAIEAAIVHVFKT